MKTRIISALIGLVVLFVVIMNFDSVFLNFAVSVVIIIAIDELLGASKLKGNKPICIVTYLFGAVLPFLKVSLFEDKIPLIIFAFVFLIMLIMLKYHTELSIVTVGFTIAFTIAISLSGTCLVYMRDLYGKNIGLYAVVVILTGAWMSDTGAYFTGVFFGKHKMAPLISPKKTVEGAVGGVVVCIISEVLFSFLYVLILEKFGVRLSVDYIALTLLSPFISLVSIVGDLSASIIKRQSGIKDFGKIMPGHGGILDRFDSVLMVIPVVYIIFSIHPLITIL